MSDAETRSMQAAYDELVVGFLAPLVSGEGTATLGRPVAPGVLDYFARTRAGSAEAESRLFDALHRAGSEIAPIETVPWPSRDLLGIAMIAHDLAFLTDPSLDRLFARGARAVVLGWIDQLLGGVRPPATRGDALARHAIVSAFLALRRNDVVVRNWAYTYRFFGRPVPANVVAMPRLRFVRQEQTTRDVMGLLGGDEPGASSLRLGERLRALVARSPVTELVRPDRFAPLRFGLAGLRVLSDPALRGGIARELAALGEWTAARHLGTALEAPELAGGPPALLSPALALLLELHVTATLGSRGARDPIPVLEGGMARYAALLPAWLEDPLALEEIRALDDDDRALLQKRAEQLRRSIPSDLLADTVRLVTRARTVAPVPNVSHSIEVSS
jgi:hypothetical protein